MKKQEQNKEHVERVFQKLGVLPVLREKVGDYDIFYGDGYSRPPHLQWQSRHEIDPGQYPLGAFVTLWWIGKDEKLLIGRPVFFEVTELSQASRINAARKDAQKTFRHLGKH